MKDEFQNQIEKLNKDFFRYYWEMEKILVSQLKKEGQEYFLNNREYIIHLSRFEPTLKDFCEICEKTGNTGGLFLSYLHLNDIENVKIHLKKGKDSPHHFIYKDFHKYQDSGKVLKSKYISIKYDKRVERFTNWVYEKTGEIDKFLEKEWKGMLPPVIRVIFMAHRGPGPYNIYLNETYLPVKGMKKKDVLSGVRDIFHETFHLTNTNMIKKNANFEYDWNMDSFKLLDEGYAQLIELKFGHDDKEKRKRTDYYSWGIASEGVFNFYDLKDKWAELFSKDQKIDTYSLALSLSYFLEEKFGHEKLKNLFFPKKKIKENTWLEYAENYFGNKMTDLIDEWKAYLISNKTIVKEIESVKIPETCKGCKSYKDPKRKISCNLNRYRLRNDRTFKCKEFAQAEEYKK